jgi:hypothetical protein
MSVPPRSRPFRSRIYKVGINRCVDVPEGACGELGEGEYPAVRGIAGGLPLRATLVPGGKGNYRLFLHSRIWKRLRVDAGDVVELYLEGDPEPREVAPPKELLAALATHRGALAAFQSATDGLRREFVNWVQDAKRPETRDRRLRVGISHLIERARRTRERLERLAASSSKRKRGNTK